jgi:hypothetical protein
MLHQINLASEGGMAHFLSQYAGETWKRPLDDPRRRGHVYFMSDDQMRALAHQAGLSVESIDSDFGDFNGVTGRRDLIGFLRKKPSRIAVGDPRAVVLVKDVDDHTVYAVINGERLAFMSAHQFEKAGFRWEWVDEVSHDEIKAIPDGGRLELWE